MAKEKFSIQWVKKWFHALSPRRKIFVIIGAVTSVFYLLLLTYMLVLLLFFSANHVYSILLSPLGLDFGTPSQVFGIFLAFIILFFGVFMMVTGKINIYLLFGVLISTALIVFGISFIGEAYGMDLPGSFKWDLFNNANESFLLREYCNFTRLDCRSVTDKINYVEGDEVYCDFSINKNCSFYLSDFEVEISYLNMDNKSPINVSLSSKDHRAIFNFEVKKNMEGIWVTPEITNGTMTNLPFWKFMELNEIYSDEEYRSMKQSKAAAIITLVSISLFSTFVALNNFKQLIEKPKK